MSDHSKALMLALLGACAPPAPASIEAIGSELPGPAPRGRESARAQAMNISCVECHRAAAREWAVSRHAQAFTNPEYQRALAIEPLGFCRGCHAPEADPERPPDAAAAALGVACVTCHVVGDEILAASRSESDGPRAPHGVVRDGRLDFARACVRCHEFEFPDRGARGKSELMQATVSEQAGSTAARRACADCHMPASSTPGQSRRSHLFPGGHNEHLVRSAVQTSATRVDAERVRISLTPQAIGHAFPTGDLFRRVEVTAEVVGDEWQVLEARQAYLARHWTRTERGPFGVRLRTMARDDRPLDVPVALDWSFEMGSGRAIHWRVAYQRVAHPRSESEQESEVTGEIELAHGVLSP
ncbi:MAG TPA: multiheme c-type cytochrome [Polyangiaceae bacterium]|nr:multiheme c-type cytochrome [Polyangiaceae bacterium]